MPGEMVEVEFEPGRARVWVPRGITLLDASRAAGLEILTGCTEGMCGTDPVLVLSGCDGLSAPGAHEAGTLERMGLSAGFRLSCSARLLRGPVRVQIDAF